MSAAGEAQPSRGPKGAAPREFAEADTRVSIHTTWCNEAEE
jgi:hypothetical protein